MAWSTLLSAECGLRTEAEFVSGGTDAHPKDYPFLALLGVKNNSGGIPVFHCGGTIINKLYIVTAAHCQKSEGLIERFFFVAGSEAK